MAAGMSAEHFPPAPPAGAQIKQYEERNCKKTPLKYIFRKIRRLALYKSRSKAYCQGVKQSKMRIDYTAYGNGYQLCLPMNTEILIPEDDTVRLLSGIIERMINGQLKPGYNVNVATVSEYVVGTCVSADRSDVGTFIPFRQFEGSPHYGISVLRRALRNILGCLKF